MPQPLKASAREAKRYAANLTPTPPKKSEPSRPTPGQYRVVKGLSAFFIHPPLVGMVVQVRGDSAGIVGLWLLDYTLPDSCGTVRAALHEAVIRTHLERIDEAE